MEKNAVAQAFIKELQEESISTRKCLERIPENLYDYKPHPKSMSLGYLTLLVAEIPLWIQHTVEKGIIDLATFEHMKPGTSQQLVEHFDQNIEGAVAALNNITDEDLKGKFTLQSDGQELYSGLKLDTVGSSINHWVHHRGQLTVYMRLNDILVPSIYGPSADDQSFRAPGT